MFEELYQKIINKPVIHFDQFYDIQFYTKLCDNVITISDQKQKDFDCIQIKCRKLGKENWDMIFSQPNNDIREKLLLIFSIVKTNFMNIEIVQECMSLNSLNKLLKLNSVFVKYIIKKINEYITNISFNDQNYRNKLLYQFRRLYHSEKGIILKYKQIGQYLHLCSFYDKLGLNYFDLQKLPYDTYRQLLMMMGIQTEVKNEQIREMNKKTKQSSRGRR